MELYKYQGAGNDFLIADNRDGHLSFTPEQIALLCDRHYGVGADGLMLLELAEGYDFKMVYFNSDGSGGMMCGNGGRCIVAFADFCGLPTRRFIAADGPHEAEILARNGRTMIVKLKMKDVDEIIAYDEPGLTGYFLDSGTRHFVVPVNAIEACDVVGLGRKLRHASQFAPIGANVNFIEERDGQLWVRTYEKGVEDETCACGTGIVASAIAHWHITGAKANGIGKTAPQEWRAEGKAIIPIRALHDTLEVRFTPTATGAKDIYLIGPATQVAKIIL